MKMNGCILSTMLLGLTINTSCRHKDLYFDENPTLEVNVSFDWRNAPGANPESMAMYMFDKEADKTFRYIFANRTGGKVYVPYGNYDGLGMNSDDTDWAHFRNTSDVETFEIYTSDAVMLEAYGLSSRSVPRADGTESERMASTPGMVWCNRQDSISLPLSLKEKDITYYPEECVSHYTVDIYDVSNLAHVTGASIDATLSGMSEGFLFGKCSSTDTHATMPFTLDIDKDDDSLHGEFLTFGESQSHRNKHYLTVYMYISDGSKWYYTFDVSEQVYSAPDPKHVHITLRGLKFPKPITHDGGFHPNVNDWQTEYIDIKM